MEVGGWRLEVGGWREYATNTQQPSADSSRPWSDRAISGLSSVGTPSAPPDCVAFTYRDLEVWKRSMALVQATYRATEGFPRSEMFGMVSQIRRAAVSIPSNIAEGHCRRTTGAYLHHVSIALGSHGELCTLLELSRNLGYLSPQARDALLPVTDQVGRLLYGLHSALEGRRGNRP